MRWRFALFSDDERLANGAPIHGIPGHQITRTRIPRYHPQVDHALNP